MKLIIFSICMILLSFGTSFSQNDRFYSKILDDTSRNSYFVVIELNSPTFSGRVAVPNQVLFSYLNKAEPLSVQDYKNVLGKAFRDKQAVMIKEEIAIDSSGSFLKGKELPHRAFRVINEIESFSPNLSDCSRFLDEYFAPNLPTRDRSKSKACGHLIREAGVDLLLKPKISVVKQNTIIALLFENAIPIHIDDISGSLRIGFASIQD